MRTLIHGPYCIGMPDGWVDNSTISIVYPHDAEQLPASITVSSIESPPGATPQEIAETEAEQLAEDFEDFHVVKECSCTVGGEAGYERYHTFLYEDEEEGTRSVIEQWQIYMVFEMEAIVITCTSTADSFRSTYPIFVEAVNQFRYHGQ